jgi:hypothetical protein
MAILLIALMMKAARSSETLVKFYQTTRRYNPGDNHLHTHHRENLKSYYKMVVDLKMNKCHLFGIQKST